MGTIQDESVALHSTSKKPPDTKPWRTRPSVQRSKTLEFSSLKLDVVKKLGFDAKAFRLVSVHSDLTERTSEAKKAEKEIAG